MVARCRTSQCIPDLMRRYLPFIIIVLALVAAIGIFTVMFRGGTSGGDSNLGFNNSNQPAQVVDKGSAPAQATPNQSTSGSATITKPNVKISSPVILEEYGDYQCPPCGQLYPELKQIEHEYGNQLRLVFHQFPLTKIHKNALAAAHAAEAARNQNKFWEMHDRLYRNQNEWKDLDDPRPTFISYARQLNLKIEQFTSDMDSNQVDQRISADIQRGAAAGVTGTPTVFIDSQMLKYEATNLDGLRRGINAMLVRRATS
jgi:protein-disulfide isomerase